MAFIGMQHLYTPIQKVYTFPKAIPGHSKKKVLEAGFL